MTSAKPSFVVRATAWLPGLLCLAALAVNLWSIDLKGITTDEGFRLWIINGGQLRILHPASWATWGEVITAIDPYAYQPGYYLLQNSLMRLVERQDLLFFRCTNLSFLALALGGLLALSKTWANWPRAFLIGLFSFNAYLIMHIVQIREYPAAVAFYIWSTVIVLHLDRRLLQNEWPDLACFVGYGLLLGLGFYLQTWVVFPAIGQGAFLILRRRPQFWRFHAHLALSYLVVFSLTWPYLQSHGQKISIGLWERAQVTLSGQLIQGFTLVLSGHLPGHHWFTSLLPWAWIGLLLTACWWILRRRTAIPRELLAETSRQAWLMAVCIAIPLAFQIAYFFKVEPLSVWPRYFIVHYFFLTWLIALAFRTLHEAARTAARPVFCRAPLFAATALVAVSAVYQVASFRRDPYLDTSLSRESDWRIWAEKLPGILRPDDVVVMPDFISRATLTFTQPLTNPVLLPGEISPANLVHVPRVLYLEAAESRAAREEFIARLAAVGFKNLQEKDLHAADGRTVLTERRLVIFTKD